MLANEIVVALIGLLTTAVSSLITFFLTRRKYNLEMESKKIENMNDLFDYHEKVYNETVKALNRKMELLQEENARQKQQIDNLNMQMLNLMGSICLDATCKLRKAGFSSDLKFSDSGVHVGE